jgi:50S ribosomal subunit-associated GTPase HflX
VIQQKGKDDVIYASKKAYIEEKYQHKGKDMIFISATEKENIEELKSLIINSLEY